MSSTLVEREPVYSNEGAQIRRYSMDSRRDWRSLLEDLGEAWMQGDALAEPWLHFEPGTPRQVVLKWIEKRFYVSVKRDAVRSQFYHVYHAERRG